MRHKGQQSKHLTIQQLATSKQRDTFSAVQWFGWNGVRVVQTELPMERAGSSAITRMWYCFSFAIVNLGWRKTILHSSYMITQNGCRTDGLQTSRYQLAEQLQLRLYSTKPDSTCQRKWMRQQFHIHTIKHKLIYLHHLQIGPNTSQLIKHLNC